MIFTVLNVAHYSFDVLLIGLAAIAVLIHFVHYISPFPRLDLIISQTKRFYSLFNGGSVCQFIQ